MLIGAGNLIMILLELKLHKDYIIIICFLGRTLIGIGIAIGDVIVFSFVSIVY